jgi:hypothetical protein
LDSKSKTQEAGRKHGFYDWFAFSMTELLTFINPVIGTRQAVPTLDTPSIPTSSSFAAIGGSSLISPFLNALAARSESRREAEINRKGRTTNTTPQDPSVHKPGYRGPGVTGENPTDTSAGVGAVEIGGVPPPAYDG